MASPRHPRAASAQIGFEVHVYSSSGQRLSDGNPNPRELYQGDFVYCLALDADDDTHVYFAWVKVQTGHEQAPGPNFLSFPNEDDHTNRMYIGKTLGNGEDVAYSCIATDVDPYELRDEVVGAQFWFRVVEPPDAGYIFEEKDYVAFLSDTIYLACKRHSPLARVVWDTLNINGEIVNLLHDSDDTHLPLPNGYELINQDDDADDFMLSITMSEYTAIFTRCTITYNSLTDVSHTAMLFQIDFTQPGGCEADGLDPVDGNSAGQVIRFHGCDVITSFSSDTGLTKSDYTTMTYWQEGIKENPAVFFPIDKSRALDEDSVHTIQATPYTHGHSYSCTVEIHREEAGVVRAKIENICLEPFVVSVIDNTLRFRIYYGSETVDDLIRFDSLGNAAIIPSNHSLMCFLDRMPLVEGDDIIRMQYRAPGEEECREDEDHIIRDSNIHIGFNYRCVFRDTDEPANDAESGVIHMINGLVETRIFDSDGNQMDSDVVYTINSGDYIECQSIDVTDPVYPPRFVWYRSNEIENDEGPKTITQSNTGDGANRLPISDYFGAGNPISYRCIATDLPETAIIPEVDGTRIMFEAT